MRILGSTDLDLLEGLFNQHPQSPFFAKDLSLRYVAANRAMARLCDVASPRELFGRRAGDLFGVELAGHYEALDRVILTSGRSLKNLLEPTSSLGGGRAWLLFSRVPVRDAAGGVVGVAATARLLPGGSRNEFDRLMIEGVGTGGRKLKPMMEAVSKTRFSKMTPREREALYSYLKLRAEQPQ